MSLFVLGNFGTDADSLIVGSAEVPLTDSVEFRGDKPNRAVAARSGDGVSSFPSVNSAKSGLITGDANGEGDEWKLMTPTFTTDP